MALGLLLTVPLSFGDLDLGPVALSLNWQFLGVALLTVGFQAFFLGCVAQILFDYTGRHRQRWLRVFPYTRTVLIAFALVVVGIALAIPLVVTYVSDDLELERADTVANHLAVTGLAAVVLGAQLFVFTLLLHGTVVATTPVGRDLPSTNRSMSYARYYGRLASHAGYSIAKGLALPLVRSEAVRSGAHELAFPDLDLRAVAGRRRVPERL